jgi:hypothetical protein
VNRVVRTDTSKLAKFARNGAGAVRVPATTARTGVQVYPEQKLREYRPAEEVFSADSLASYAGVPVTLGHPVAGVSPANMRAVTVGHVSDLPPEQKVKLDGSPEEWVRAQLVLGDGDLLAAIEASDTPPQISCGYSCTLDMTPGVAPNGEHYDCVQRNIVLNHVAVLLGDSKARAGAEARLRLDNKEPMKIVVIDNTEYEVGSEKHLAKIAQDNQAALAAANARADKAEAARDTEKARADKAEAQLSTDSLDKLVEARLNLLKAAAPFLAATYETSGKSNLQICKDALSAAGVDCAGKSDAYVEARFDGLTAKDQPAQFHVPAAAKPAPKADANDRNDDDAFRVALEAKLKEIK